MLVQTSPQSDMIASNYSLAPLLTYMLCGLDLRYVYQEKRKKYSSFASQASVMNFTSSVLNKPCHKQQLSKMLSIPCHFQSQQMLTSQGQPSSHVGELNQHCVTCYHARHRPFGKQATFE